ncbi:UNVERIFIED_CONTAM: hypothetical protein Sradi_4423500 [Sesamum radiatum]|uniref:Reverse transcriptase domain-containing protein n=1 Tax=Sesamum radiatum TaxID=300843 RepID=A0AAW2NQX5_SESRA
MEDMNAELIRYFSLSEVQLALKQMHPLKSPGLNASAEALGCIKRILEQLEQASGLKVNLEKSAVMFSINVPQAHRMSLATILGVQVVAKHPKYLVLPTTMGRSKREVFEEKKERILKRLQGWATKELSQAGRMVLIRTVLEALPTYMMGYFELPISFVKEMEEIMANFFWYGGVEGKVP